MVDPMYDKDIAEGVLTRIKGYLVGTPTAGRGAALRQKVARAWLWLVARRRFGMMQHLWITDAPAGTPAIPEVTRQIDQAMALTKRDAVSVLWLLMDWFNRGVERGIAQEQERILRENRATLLLLAPGGDYTTMLGLVAAMERARLDVGHESIASELIERHGLDIGLAYMNRITRLQMELTGRPVVIAPESRQVH